MVKSAEAFRTISEVSELLNTPAHVLRFWESRFTQIRPVKRAGGRRYYRPNDLALLAGIKRLLHDDGMTIRGVQKILKERGVPHVCALATIALPQDDEAPGHGGATLETAGGWPVSDSPDAAPADVHLAPDPADPVPPVADVAPVPWPLGATPDVGPRGGHLVHDPEDMGIGGADPDEAPMHVDAPLLPAVGARILSATDRTRGAPAPVGHAAQAELPPAPAAADDDHRLPAAKLLRAMDALRAEDNRGELTSVFMRLRKLHDRLMAASDATRS